MGGTGGSSNVSNSNNSSNKGACLTGDVCLSKFRCLLGGGQLKDPGACNDPGMADPWCCQLPSSTSSRSSTPCASAASSATCYPSGCAVVEVGQIGSPNFQCTLQTNLSNEQFIRINASETCTFGRCTNPVPKMCYVPTNPANRSQPMPGAVCCTGSASSSSANSSSKKAQCIKNSDCPLGKRSCAVCKTQKDGSCAMECTSYSAKCENDWCVDIPIPEYIACSAEQCPTSKSNSSSSSRSSSSSSRSFLHSTYVPLPPLPPSFSPLPSFFPTAPAASCPSGSICMSNQLCFNLGGTNNDQGNACGDNKGCCTFIR